MNKRKKTNAWCLLKSCGALFFLVSFCSWSDISWVPKENRALWMTSCNTGLDILILRVCVCLCGSLLISLACAFLPQGHPLTLLNILPLLDTDTHTHSHAHNHVDFTLLSVCRAHMLTHWINSASVPWCGSCVNACRGEGWVCAELQIDKWNLPHWERDELLKSAGQLEKYMERHTPSCPKAVVRTCQQLSWGWSMCTISLSGS